MVDKVAVTVLSCNAFFCGNLGNVQYVWPLQCTVCQRTSVTVFLVLTQFGSWGPINKIGGKNWKKK